VRRVLLGLALALALACGRTGDDGPPPVLGCPQLAASDVRATGVVLVVADTLRRDGVGIHGGAGTPAFDGFARQHLLFERASSQAPWTKPSIATLFTGLVPSRHGVLDDPRLPGRASATAPREADALPGALDTLAERFQRAGFRTAAFVSNPWMGEAFGYAQGFDVYDDSFAHFDAAGARVTQRGLEWLTQVAPGERFFLYVHYIDPHAPYGALSPEEVYVERARLDADARRVPPLALEALADLRTPELWRLLLATGAQPTLGLLELAYERGVEDFDAAFGALLEGLRARGDWARTAVIATSDHGEAFYQRGYGNHARALHDDELAVPLAARLPGVTPARGRIDCQVGLVDLMPTLCDAQGLGCDAGDGRSLLANGADARPPRTLLAEGVPGLPTHRAARSGRFKLIYEPEGPLGPNLTRDTERGRAHAYSLYDLDADPAEQRDLLDAPAPDAEAQQAFGALRAALEQAAAATVAAPPERAPLDPDTARRLEALGYLDAR
jgi:arylsulfatase A-like enzyme